jgi:hypothetical protein
MRYRIICDNQQPVAVPKNHAHIVQIGTGTTTQHYEKLWMLAQVIAAIERGDTFYTQSPSTGKQAAVIVVACGVCRHNIVRSTADAVADNNLDNLPECA